MPWAPDDNRTPVILSGTVDAHQIDLSFQAQGRVRQLRSDEGRSVESGAVVAELVAIDYELALARAQALETSAEKALAALRAGPRPQETRGAAAILMQAEADKRYADAQVARTSGLVEKMFVSPDALDRARSAADMAAARTEQARQTLSLVREGARKEDLERAASELRAATAVRRIAEQQLSYVQLISPTDGVVSVRLAEAGQVVAVGQRVFRIAQLARPWVRAYLAESDLPRVKLGQSADVRVDGVPGKTFKGVLSFISPRAEFTPKTVQTKALRVDLVYRVQVDVDNPDGALKIGMPADVSLAVSAP
jgi:HlyD family secretion protein